MQQQALFVAPRGRPTRSLLSRLATVLAAALIAALSIAGPGVGRAEAQTATGDWIPTGSTTRPRDFHAAARLNDGSVMVAGSFDDEALGTFFEIYNPSSGTWSSLGSNEFLFDSSLTTLDDGRVLHAGGRISTLVGTTRASLVDPNTNTVTPTGSLNVRRANHAAVKLTDGRVLVAGGETDSRGPGQGSGYTAEIFDPATGQWTPTAPMNALRTRPTAELLSDGRVLVVGGGSAEVYNPATNTWAATGPLANLTGGLNHAMTRLADGRVMSVGGSTGTDGVRDVAIYDPATNQWTAAAPLIEGRSFHTATLLLDGRVLVAGGHQVGPNWHSEIYDPATRTWAAGPDLNRRRDTHTATLLTDGRVLVAGTALATTTDRRSAELFVPGATQPPPAPWNLTVRTFKQGGTNRATLTWSPQPNTETYSIWFNGTFNGTTTATTLTHNTGLKGKRTGTYLVCANIPVPCTSITATW